MATRAQWIEGARLRTLPLAVSSVIVGTAVAIAHDQVRPVRALLALIVGLSLQIGVNLANDYSDGVRGTDAYRVGPQRLVGSGAAAPRTVKRAAFGCFGVGAVAGLVLVVLSHQWWILAVGVITIAAAWFYTGGRHPYGYMGLGDLSVFIFFGLVSTAGTTLTQQGRLDLTTLVASCIGGFGACAVLMANNLRDIPTDLAAGKHTMAAMLGDARSRVVFVAYCVLTVAAVVGVAAMTTWWGLLGLVLLFWMAPALIFVVRGGTGPGLIRVLKQVSIAEFAAAIGLLVGVVLARL